MNSECKLFVGGISPKTTEKELRDHFDQYGKVSMATVFRKRHDHSSRGFGFVIFSDHSAVDAVLAQEHVILGKTVDVKRAIPRDELPPPNRYIVSSDQDFTRKKIFVGGLAHDISIEEFKSYFQQFGNISDAVVMHDKMKHHPRGFGFVTFESEESVVGALQNTFHLLKGKRVEVKRAVQKEVIYSINSVRGGRDQLQQYYPSYPVPVHAYSPYGVFPYHYCWYPMAGLGGFGWYGVYGQNCYQVPYTVQAEKGYRRFETQKAESVAEEHGMEFF